MFFRNDSGAGSVWSGDESGVYWHRRWSGRHDSGRQNG